MGIVLAELGAGASLVEPMRSRQNHNLVIKVHITM